MKKRSGSDENFRRRFEPRTGLRHIFAGYVTLAANGATVDLKPGEVIWVIGPLDPALDDPIYTRCSRVLTRLGVGLVANTALYDFTVQL